MVVPQTETIDEIALSAMASAEEIMQAYRLARMFGVPLVFILGE